MAKKTTKTDAQILFDMLVESVEQTLATDERLKQAVVIVESDYRGFKFDAMTVRVYKQARSDGKVGIISRPVYS